VTGRYCNKAEVRRMLSLASCCSCIVSYCISSVVGNIIITQYCTVDGLSNYLASRLIIFPGSLHFAIVLINTDGRTGWPVSLWRPLHLPLSFLTLSRTHFTLAVQPVLAGQCEVVGFCFMRGL